MEILEIVRLALSNSGIGLLPFTLVGLLSAMVLLLARARRYADPSAIGYVLLPYWGACRLL